jgi:hypothetical protein
MSWADYHLDDPTFCKPMVVAEGLLRALFERQRASYIAQYGGGWDWTLDEYRDRIFPDIFTKNDVLSVKGFCRNFDGYLALFAWTNINVWECPIAGLLGPLGACARTCQYYPWYGQENTCPGYQSTLIDTNGNTYNLRSLLNDIGDEELIDAYRLDINQPSLYVPWVLQRVKMLKKLRRFKDTSPSIVLTTEECDWGDSIYDSPYHSRQAAADGVPREIRTETYYSNPGFHCFTRMYDDVCVDLELRLPVSAAPYYDEEMPDELKPKSGYLVVNVADPFVGTFDPLNAPVTKGLTTFQLQEDGTFFSNWPTGIVVPDYPDDDYLTIGWDMQREYAVYDFNSVFEFQE